MALDRGLHRLHMFSTRPSHNSLCDQALAHWYEFVRCDQQQALLSHGAGKRLPSVSVTNSTS
jgi:hypothetical protein